VRDVAERLEKRGYRRDGYVKKREESQKKINETGKIIDYRDTGETKDNHGRQEIF